MDTKLCSGCNILFPHTTENFYSYGTSGKLRSRCRKCYNRGKKKKCYAELSDAAKERGLQATKAYYYANRDHCLARTKAYVKDRRAYYAQKNREWRARMRENPEYKLLDAVRTSFKRGLKSQGVRKDNKVWSMLPYTVEALRKHLESKFTDIMSWDNYGSNWHIDHIIPLAALPFKTFDEPNFYAAWGLANLRPLSASENFKKGSYHDGVRWSYDYAQPMAGNSTEN